MKREDYCRYRVHHNGGFARTNEEPCLMASHTTLSSKDVVCSKEPIQGDWVKVEEVYTRDGIYDGALKGEFVHKRFLSQAYVPDEKKAAA